MPAKRVKRKVSSVIPEVLAQLEAPEDEPLMLTCPDCGAQVEQTAHSCPHCGSLFYERQRGKARRVPSTGPHREDAAVADFAQRMDRIEKWTRVLCVIAGIVFALLAVLSLVGTFLVPMGVGGRGLAGLLIFGLLSAVCLARGLKGEGADLSILDKLPGFRSFRLR